MSTGNGSTPGPNGADPAEHKDQPVAVHTPLTPGELIKLAEKDQPGEVRIVVGAGEVLDTGYDQTEAEARARAALRRVLDKQPAHVRVKRWITHYL